MNFEIWVYANICNFYKLIWLCTWRDILKSIKNNDVKSEIKFGHEKQKESHFASPSAKLHNQKCAAIYNHVSQSLTIDRNPSSPLFYSFDSFKCSNSLGLKISYDFQREKFTKFNL